MKASLLLICLILVLTACGTSSSPTNNASGTNSNSQNQNASSGDKITLQYWTSARHDAEYMKQAIDKFNTTNTDNIEVVFTGFSENFNQALEVAFASGQAPDVFQTFDLPTYVLKDYLEPFDSYISEDMKAKFQHALQDNINMFNGHIYSLPAYGYTYRLIYNNELFERAGLTGPPTSLAQMVEYAKAITEMGKSEGIYGFALNFKNPQNAFDRSIRQILPVSGYGEYGYDTKTGQYDFAPYAEAVEYFKQMYEDGSMLPGIEALDIDPLRAQFTEGKIGMYFSFSVEPGVYQDQFPTAIDWRAAQAPSLTGTQIGPSPNLGGSWIGISKDTKYKEAAWKFIEFMYTDEIMKGYHEAGLGLSVIPSVSEVANDPAINGIQYFIPTEKDALWPASPNIKAEGLSYGEVFFRYMLSGGNIDDIVNDLNQRYNQALQKGIERGDITLKADSAFDPAKLFPQ